MLSRHHIMRLRPFSFVGNPFGNFIILASVSLSSTCRLCIKVSSGRFSISQTPPTILLGRPHAGPFLGEIKFHNRRRLFSQIRCLQVLLMQKVVDGTKPCTIPKGDSKQFLDSKSRASDRVQQAILSSGGKMIQRDGRKSVTASDDFGRSNANVVWGKVTMSQL